MLDDFWHFNIDNYKDACSIVPFLVHKKVYFKYYPHVDGGELWISKSYEHGLEFMNKCGYYPD